MTPYEIPLSSTPQTFKITLAGVQYQMTVKWNWVNESWMLDIADTSGNTIIAGIPLVTGADLLEQYGYLNFGGRLICQTDNDPDAVPTFENLGTTGHVYFLVG